MIAPSLLRSRLFAGVLATGSTVLVSAGLVYLYFFHPHLTVGPPQPVPFSHRLHVSVKQIDCRFCHYAAGRTPNAGLPSTKKCLYCHRYIIPLHPQIRKVNAHSERAEAIPWRKVTWLPDHAYFSHQRHIRKGVECQSCHGEIETMDRVHEVNKFKMGFCVKCHRERNASLDCWACHW